jgi:hypothetical protein
MQHIQFATHHTVFVFEAADDVAIRLSDMNARPFEPEYNMRYEEPTKDHCGGRNHTELPKPWVRRVHENRPFFHNPATGTSMYEFPVPVKEETWSRYLPSMWKKEQSRAEREKRAAATLEARMAV